MSQALTLGAAAFLVAAALTTRLARWAADAANALIEDDEGR
jgi:hypothetical protein